jgi:hypothetical protein
MFDASMARWACQWCANGFFQTKQSDIQLITAVVEFTTVHNDEGNLGV